MVGSEHSADNALGRSTVAEIQRKIIKQGKRSAVSRFLRAKDDKDTIATWRSDLNGILLVFNVCFVTSVRPLLTICFQTELAMNTHVVVSDTHTIVSDIHRTIVKSQEGTNSGNPPVGAAQQTLTQARSAISTTNKPSILYLHLAYLENPHHRHREPSSDVKT